MPNSVVWFEVIGNNGPALRKFYRDVFGWKISEGNPNNSVDYGLVEAEGGGVPGGIGASTDRHPGFATFVVEAEDPAPILAKAARLGGRTVMPVVRIPGLDTEKAYIADPEGNVICIT